VTDATVVTIWVDPSCPWAWQTATWLRRLRDLGVLTIRWRLFSLEINAVGPDVPFAEATERYGQALVALALSRRDGGDEAFERLFVAFGTHLHEAREPISPESIRRAAIEAGAPDLADRAAAEPGLGQAVVQEYLDARALDVFGVPTVQLGEGPVMYGPIMPLAPSGEEAVEWWEHVSWLIGRDDLYELKRWPRGRPPGSARP
jgi:DSBA-like thioredoxin domain